MLQLPEAGPDTLIADTLGAGGFGVYIHWPFCAAKCPYCDFNSHVRHQDIDEPRFAAALVRELRTLAERVPGRRVDSIFLGGGTPSLMAPRTVATVLEAIARLWPLAEDVEVTLEANPSSVEAGRFRGYRSAGVNRVSLGVQALNDDDLKALGRLHDRATALAAIETARRTFPRLSFDLIYARAGQTAAAWEQELRWAIDLAADHLSLYQLTIEDGTPFAALHRAGKLILPDAETAAELYEVTQAVTAAHGLAAYEVSNHARPGAESRHNLVYWRSGDFAGAGPGAHGRLTHGGRRRATATERYPETWLGLVEARGHGLIEDSVLAPAQTAAEMLMMGLRLSEGIDLARFTRLGGRLDAERLRDLAEAGLLARPMSDRLVATPAGRLVLDRLVSELIG